MAMYRWLIDEQLSLRMIMRRLMDGPWRPRRGGRLWSHSVVHRILSDPVYVGIGHSNRFYRTTSPDPRRRNRRPDDLTCRRERPREEWIPIPVPAIIDEQTHEHAVAQLARNADLAARRNNRHFYLLRCLLTCQRCGRAMVGITHPNAKGGPRRFYKCCGREPLCPALQPRCTRLLMRAEELEAAVWDHIRRLLDNPATLTSPFEAFTRSTADRAATARAEVQKWEAQLGRLDREDVRLVDAYQADVISLDELKERRQQLQARRQILVAQRAQQEKLRGEHQAAQAVWQELTAFCGQVRARLDVLTPIEKQRILQLLVERIIVGEDTLEIRHVIALRPLKSESAREAMPSGPSEGSDAEGASPEQPDVRLRSDRVLLARLLGLVVPLFGDPGGGAMRTGHPVGPAIWRTVSKHLTSSMRFRMFRIIATCRMPKTRNGFTASLWRSQGNCRARRRRRETTPRNAG